MPISRAAASLLTLALTACHPADTPSQASGAAGSAKRGQELLAQYQCGSCHAIPGVDSAGGKVATSLKSFGARSYIAGRMPNRAGQLAQWIHKPQSLVPGTLMPEMGVTPADARDMAAYLLELR